MSHSKSTLRPFLAMIANHWTAMALGTGLALLAALSAIGLLSLSGWFIAATALAGLNPASAQVFNFFFPSIGVRLLAMLRTLARYGERIVSHEATFRILETLRTWCYRKIEPLAPAGLSRFHSGDLLSRIITDIDTLDNLYLRMLSPTVTAALTIVLVFSFIFFFHPLMALIASTALAIAATVIPLAGQRLGRSAARNLNDRNAELRTSVVDGIHGLAALLSCGAENRYLWKVAQHHMALVKEQFRMSRITGLTAALMGLISGAAMIGTLYIGAGAVTAGRLTGPDLALVTLAVMAAFDAVMVLPTAFQYLGQTRRAASRLQAVTGLEPAVAYPHDGPKAEGPLDIRFENVHFRYADSREAVLKNVNLHISHGQRLAILGATGAGKSSLLYLLARFEDPTAGKITLGRLPLNRLAESELREQICIIEQRSHIFNGTIRDNLSMAAPQAGEEQIYEALRICQLRDFVTGLPEGLQTWVGECGRLLSGGQARRLAVARAVLSSAPIWLLDEPTEGLDPETADAMMTALLDKGRGKTIVMITHRSEAIQSMDRVVTLKNGRIISNGRPGQAIR